MHLSVGIFCRHRMCLRPPTHQAIHLIVLSHLDRALVYLTCQDQVLGRIRPAMAPPNLQGLNLVPSTVSNPYLSDSQDLLSNPHFPELNAQLDLWTTLAFESDEPLGRRTSSASNGGAGQPSPSGDGEDEEDEDPVAGPAPTDKHDNVVLANPVNNIPSSASTQATQVPFDINSILAGLGVDPFALPSFPQSPLPAAAPSLAQILSLYPVHALGYPPPPAQAAASPGSHAQPPAKRARTRKISTSTIADDIPISPSTPDGSAPLSASEDKRRRNTAASARFRLKKKEREVALETKAKELEQRVAELERECEGLRRENGWLKGLVVGVTGAGAAQSSQTGSKRHREGSVEQLESK